MTGLKKINRELQQQPIKKESVNSNRAFEVIQLIGEKQKKE